MTRRAPFAVATLAALGGAGYWTMMSSWSQLLGSFPWRGATDEKVVALSFDDGPNEPFTGRLADLLALKGVLGTFFEVGANVAKYPDSSRRLLAEGHVIGNHSWSHQFHRCFDDRVMADEVRRTQDILTEVTGVRPTLYRPPWLLRTPGLFRTLDVEGLTPISGEFCHELEPFQIPSDLIAKRAVGRTRPGKILIFHDGFDARGGNRAQTVAAAGKAIDILGERGYRFVTVPELLPAA